MPKDKRRDPIEEIMRESTSRRLLVKPKPQPAAADEMWLLGGPETTSQGGFALSRAKLKKMLRQRMGMA